ncbi:hypothetical protein EON80_05970, partial [bacterium]
MRRSIHSPSARRRGQALLLAVLIMIFAALLSAAFIGIVAVNLNQTARESDKNLALDSARSGLAIVNQQLTYSAQGDRWRPAAPPIPTDLTYKTYYSPLDEAQGWAGNFAKFPDPRGLPTDGPQFLVKIEKIPLTLAVGNPEFDKIGATKITVIGLSPEDPTAYHRIVAYKGGVKRAPLGQAIRVVSNYDFKANQTYVARFDGGTNTGTTGPNFQLGVNNATADFSKLGLPFPIALYDPNSTNPTRTGIVTAVAGTLPNFTFNLAEALPAAPTATTRIELAANLGGANSLAPDPLSPAVTTLFTTPLALTDKSVNTDPTFANQVDGARVNGSLIWSGNISAINMRAPSSSYGATGLIPGTIQVSGAIAPDRVTTPPTLKIQPTGGGASDTLKASDSTGVFATNNLANGNEFVEDGWNKNRGVPDSSTTVRSVPDFRPPSFDSGA